LYWWLYWWCVVCVMWLSKKKIHFYEGDDGDDDGI
jgi:hypothetical protein